VPAEPVVTSWAGARADDAGVTFRFADPEHALAGVRLQQEVRIPAGRLDFRGVDRGWELVLGRPPVARLEYLLELSYPDGESKVVLDPANPRQAAGAFGPKSVLEFPGYGAPAWLSAAVGRGSTRTLEVPAADGVISVRLWAPAGTPDDAALPLLLVHDGPEYDALASITRYLSAGVKGKWLPRLRAALLGPGQRNAWYSANPWYARTLANAVLPAVTSRVAVSHRIGMGTSLGALAMLHAYCRYPACFDALFLQSGSFFVPSLDSQEQRFPYYRRICGFIADARGGGLPNRPVPVVLTCGAIEENAANNRLLTQALRAHEYPATLHEVPDVHNYTAWRDAFDPYLTALVGRVAK
jgi:enterochelin esterase-like enzyme